MTKTHFNGTLVVFLINSTTLLASGTRKGGSIRAAALLPTMRVVTLDRPFSDDEMKCVCKTMMSVNQVHAGLIESRVLLEDAANWGISPHDAKLTSRFAEKLFSLRAGSCA